jgi:hypothetical protein
MTLMAETFLGIGVGSDSRTAERSQSCMEFVATIFWKRTGARQSGGMVQSVRFWI